MIQVNSSQYNYQYGNQIHLPYSIAMLYSYIKTKPNLSSNFKFEKTFVFRDKVDDDITKCKDTDILLCSCYVWNWEITLHLAKEVKKLNPECLIIFGGPQVPEDTKGFFKKCPFVDMLVHSEGEYILESILDTYLKNRDYSDVKGITTKELSTYPQDRINNLDLLPSPYLTGDIWELIDKIDGINWDASWETHRGCPYLCTFCDWGSATFTKMRQFSEERLFKEIDWFADNEIVYVDVCDANFGIYVERDLRIAKKFKDTVLQKKFPKKIRPAWAKNTTEKIIPIARELQEGGILGAVTLAVQSLDKETLDIIKRANIKFDKFADLTTEFRLNGLPTYTEIILGLPGETLESYKRGLETIAHTKIDTVFIYNCTVLPNAPMNLPDYREKYKIKVIRSPVMLVHSSIEKRGIQEFEDIIVGASTYTLDELKEMRLYSWAFITLQNLGILEYIARYYNQTHGLSFMEFYDKFFEYCQLHESIFSDEYKKVLKYIDDGYSGQGWDHYDLELGDIIWPIEEASWLRLVFSKQKLLEAIYNFLRYFENKSLLKTPTSILEELAKFQVFLLTTQNTNDVKQEEFEYNWKTFFLDNTKLISAQKNYYFKNPVIESDLKQWCKETIWYGRRSNRFKCNPEKLEENTPKVKVPKTKFH
jgi:radical SAM superfamily enzyme YgiQ (UPF0313 family)